MSDPTKSIILPRGRGRRLPQRLKVVQFCDAIVATAILDRLLHHCHIVNIRGNSYRMREHQDWLPAATEKRRQEVAR